MTEAETPAPEPRPTRVRKVPSWVWPLALLLVGLYVFWVLPRQLPDRPPTIEFSSEK